MKKPRVAKQAPTSKIKKLKIDKFIKSKLAINDDSKLLSDILSLLFAQQKQVVLDPQKYKAVRCSRRSGKSMMATLYLIYNAIKYPGTVCMYLGLTRAIAKAQLISTDKYLLNFLDKLNIEYTLDLTDLDIKLSNGSIIKVAGLDSDQNQSAKILGGKLSLVVIDEAAQWRQDLVRLINNTLKPMLAGGCGPNNNGSILLIGTPDNRANYFYTLTGPVEKRPEGWAVYHWIARDNPFMTNEIEQLMHEYRIQYPGCDHDPEAGGYADYHTQFLGQWVFDTSKNVYHFRPEKNIGERPRDVRGTYDYIIGIDFGFTDSTAIVVLATHREDPTLYVIDEFKKTETDITEVAEQINKFKKEYPFARIVADSQAAQTIAELRRRHYLNIQAAEKTDKSQYQRFVNSSFYTSQIKVDPKCKEFIKELTDLVYAPVFNPGEKRREDPRCENHLCDAFLYGYRICKAYLNVPLFEAKFHSPADELNDKVRKLVLKRHNNRSNPNSAYKRFKI